MSALELARSSGARSHRRSLPRVVRVRGEPVGVERRRLGGARHRRDSRARRPLTLPSWRRSSRDSTSGSSSRRAPPGFLRRGSRCTACCPCRCSSGWARAGWSSRTTASRCGCSAAPAPPGCSPSCSAAVAGVAPRRRRLGGPPDPSLGRGVVAPARLVDRAGLRPLPRACRVRPRRGRRRACDRISLGCAAAASWRASVATPTGRSRERWRSPWARVRFGAGAWLPPEHGWRLMRRHGRLLMIGDGARDVAMAVVVPGRGGRDAWFTTLGLADGDLASSALEPSPRPTPRPPRTRVASARRCSTPAAARRAATIRSRPTSAAGGSARRSTRCHRSSRFAPAPPPARGRCRPSRSSIASIASPTELP